MVRMAKRHQQRRLGVYQFAILICVITIHDVATCPVDNPRWFLFSGECYAFYDNSGRSLVLSQVQFICSSNQAEPVGLMPKPVTEALTNAVGNQPFYKELVGFNNPGRSFKWRWNADTVFDHTVGYLRVKMCGTLSLDGARQNQKCVSGYMCKTQRNIQPEKASPTIPSPQLARPGNGVPTNQEVTCPPGQRWFSVRTSCYGFYSDAHVSPTADAFPSVDDAQAVCSRNQATLLTDFNSQENNIMLKEMSQNQFYQKGVGFEEGRKGFRWSANAGLSRSGDVSYVRVDFCGAYDEGTDIPKCASGFVCKRSELEQTPVITPPPFVGNRERVTVAPAITPVPPIGVPLAPVTSKIPDLGCGVPRSPRTAPFIYNGFAASITEYPWQVAIRHYSAQNGWAIVCGGALIYQEWIITAAHCVTETESSVKLQRDHLEILLGLQYSQKLEENNGKEAKRQVGDILIPAEFQPDTLYADIALIRLDIPVEFNERMLPVCLPDPDLGFTTDLRPGLQGLVTGYGLAIREFRSAELRAARVTVLSNSSCIYAKRRKRALEVRRKRSKRNPVFSSDNFCAGGSFSNGAGQACRGDSGGPITFNYGTPTSPWWVLEGLVSWGEISCSTSSVFVKISYHLQWIKTTITAR